MDFLKHANSLPLSLSLNGGGEIERSNEGDTDVD